MRRRDVLTFGVGCLAAAAPMLRDGRSQSSYPERSIRLVIPFVPGGVADRIGRLWADRMKPVFGAVIVENQGGGGGLTGQATVARSHPDGRTLLLASVASQAAIPAATGQA